MRFRTHSIRSMIMKFNKKFKYLPIKAIISNGDKPMCKGCKKVYKLNCIKIFIAIFIVVLIYFIIAKKLNDSSFKIENITCNSYSPCYNLRSSKSMPIILGWNNLVDNNNIMDIQTGLYNTDECKYECEYTTNKDLYMNATAIIFHIRAEHKKLPKIRFSNQLYVFFLDESPFYTWDYFKDVPNNFFNITMTYRVDSDIYYPYDIFIPCNGKCHVDEYWSEKEVLEKVRRKNRLAMKAYSDCVTPSRRENLVAELGKLIKIDLYGHCPGTTKCDTDYCINQELANHMFYMAFENSVCKNYITEKFWYLKHLIVPVVLSRRVFRQTKIPDNVYIAVDDFNTVEELAEYLLYLQKNKTAYLKYFDWTKTYRKTTYRQGYYKYSPLGRQSYINALNASYAPAYNPICNLCELAHKHHKKQQRHIIRNIWNYWISKHICIDNWSDIWLKGKIEKVYKRSKWL
uniref:Fucosyltransferase n=1 Tax=Meloidogyne enterolobii TaxID=390850 RepID=A0A6V7W3P8_MELEN|nr:unnamed protein product [Meloidogyne enterolobii]